MSDLLHPACVDIVEVGALLWCLHLRKQTENTWKPLSSITSREPRRFWNFLSSHQISPEASFHKFLADSLNDEDVDKTTRAAKGKSKFPVAQECSRFDATRSRKSIHAAAQLYKYQHEARDSQCGRQKMLTILKEHGLCGASLVKIPRKSETWTTKAQVFPQQTLETDL